MYIIFMQNAFNSNSPFDKMVGYYIQVSQSFLADYEEKLHSIIEDIEQEVLDGTGGPDIVPGMSVQDSLGWESYEFESKEDLRRKFQELLKKANLSHHEIHCYEYDCN